MIRFTITGEYPVELENYDGATNLDEAMRFDKADYEAHGIAAVDLIEWAETLTVKFEVVG